MIRVANNRIEISGPINMADSAGLLAEGMAALSAIGAANVAEFDLAGVTDIDSSALAVVFGWMRVAQASGKSIQLVNPPQNFLSLATVYGVTDLLPQH
jgi:phospholipid transport system transporter-binding protein